MHDYLAKSYGRNEDVAALNKLFDAGRDVSMPGPRRLGKTFLLDRLVDAAGAQGWIAVKVEVAGCCDTRAFFRELCSRIGGKRTGGQNVVDWVKQHLKQLVDPRSDSSGPWYAFMLSLDHEAYFERLITAMNDDPERRWVLLIDELPIFLKALHDKGAGGVEDARAFMNLTSRLRVSCPRVRWMITGSIGLEPLAKAGNYMGVLAKFYAYELRPLNETQAKDYVKDLAQTGQLMFRRMLTDVEAQAIVDAVGWRAPYYLDALAQKVSGEPCENAQEAADLIEDAVNRLLQPTESSTFGVWEEHLRKHYHGTDLTVAFAALAALAPNPGGLTINALLAAIGQVSVTRASLRDVLTRLHVEGFLTFSDWDSDNPVVAFRNLLLRRWWSRFQPHASA